MIEKEYEMKMMLSKREYRRLLHMLMHLKYRKTVQTNYYYDTLSGTLRSQNITFRIRKKDHKLTQTVKRHLPKEHCSREESFPVDTVPREMLWEGYKVALLGSLKTHRREWQIMTGLTLVLDRNKYLNTVDYELELEYLPELTQTAEAIMRFIRLASCDVDEQKHTVAKSERFFNRLYTK